VMAGSHQGTTGPIVMRNPGLLMDVLLSKGASFSQDVSHKCNFAFLLQLVT
jgi:hypothetical protein